LSPLPRRMVSLLSLSAPSKRSLPLLQLRFPIIAGLVVQTVVASTTFGWRILPGL
jgi:hypothetical protein